MPAQKRKRRIQSRSKLRQYGLPAAGVLGGATIGGGAGFMTHRKYAQAAHVRQLALLNSIGNFLIQPNPETQQNIFNIFNKAPLFYANLINPTDPLKVRQSMQTVLNRRPVLAREIGILIDRLSEPVKPSLFGKILTQKIFLNN